VEKIKENQDNKRLNNNQPPLLPQLNNNQLPLLLLLNKSRLKRRENKEEEDQEKVNNDHFVYEYKIL
jgi:GTPase SAR1 family protein